MSPAYLQLVRDGQIQERLKLADEMLLSCRSCAWECGINRLDGDMGVCKSGALARVSSYGPHMGEESPLRGWRGSGTVFFNRCNLRCQYCQNADISQYDSGIQVTIDELASIFLEIQGLGCHNINLVSPSHFVPQIVQAVYLAAQRGLNLPIVYNTGGYDSLEALAILDGIVDIYMPDMKYARTQNARRYSRISNYPRINQAAVREMHRQVGDLVVDPDGLAIRGLLIRHLVLPNNLAGSAQIMKFIAQEISTNTYVNIMDQYYPSYRAKAFPMINRRIHPEEFTAAVKSAQEVGLNRLDHIGSHL